MAASTWKADQVSPPYAGGTDSVSNVVLYSTTTGHNSDLLPAGFAGKYVRITPVGGNLYYHFAPVAVEVDRTVSATTTGATSAKLGDYLANGMSDHVLLPNLSAVYFNREADATTSVFIRVASP